MKEKKTYKDFGKVTLGESEDFRPNEMWKEQGLLCEWEHCIENTPVNEKGFGRADCPIFGHRCPKGADQVLRCRGIATELWRKIKDRFRYR